MGPQYSGALAVLAHLCLVSCALAQTDVSLPLGGHYREGRYFPVHVFAQVGGASILLSADGTMPTQIETGTGRVDAIVPWLPVREIAGPSWSNSAQPTPIAAPLTPLGEDDRLVAFAGADGYQSDAALLFPDKKIVPVQLDTSRPGRLLAPAAAYEVLDAVVLDAGAAARVDESDLAVLLAGGTTVALRTDARPGGAWPWQRVGPFWVVRHDVAGPQGAVEPGAYEPTYGWVRGWPAGVRRQAVGGAVVFGILVIGLTLWRSRYSVAAIVALSVLATGAAAAWAMHVSPVLATGGDVLVWDGALAQQDRWTYRTTFRPSDVSFPFEGLAHPALASRKQLDQTGLRLVCRADGRPDHLAAHLEMDHTLAVLSRTVRPEPPAGGATKPVSSPLLVLANPLYPGKVAGQLPPGPGATWETVLVSTAPASGAGKP